MNLKGTYVICLILLTRIVFAQEGIPVFADYLSDNIYLVHPSMAGASNANKIRFTARKQWFDVANAPSLQSANMNFRVGDKTGFGSIIFKDKNGRFSQTGIYLTFAYHLLFSRDRTDLNMLSFGLSGGLIQTNVDFRGLFDINDFDPVVERDQIQKDPYYNVDFGMSYHYLEWYGHFTVKNIIPIKRDIFLNTNPPVREPSNQRRYLMSLGRVFSFGEKWSFEPSVLYQVTERTQESSVDVNAKAYRELNERTVLWGGLSYRRSLDGAAFSADGVLVENQKLQYFTPFLGVNYKKWMVGYTFSYQSNTVVLSNGGFHQLTLGYDFGKLKERWHCKCPALNSIE